MVPDRGSDSQKASGDSCGGFAYKQDSIVVTLDQAAFGGEIEDVGGFGTLMRRKMVA